MAQPKLDRDLSVISNSGLEISYLNGDLNIIQKLDDEPNDVGGLSSAELKAKFDEAGNIIKTYINETLIPELLAADATEKSRAEAEAARAAAETARETAEGERTAAEDARKTAETARAEAETSRASAEATRQEQESARQSAETARGTAESGRATAETARAEAETARGAQEATRNENERVRNSNETARVGNEQDRATAEAARTNAESARAAAEQSRVSAENARNVWENYSGAATYAPGNKVAYQGSSYVNIAPCTGVPPTDAGHWLLIAKKGEDGDGSGDMLKSTYDPDSTVAEAGGIAAYGNAQYLPKEHTRPASLLDVVTEQDFQPVQSRVMMVTVPAETVTLSPADLPAYLAGLPRLLIRELKITLTAGTCTEAVRFNRFYGPGTISVTGAANAASLLTGGLEVKECSVEITLKQLAISGKLAGNSTFAVNTAPYVLLQDSTVNGGAEGYGVSAYEGANVALLRVTLSNCAYVVMAGYSSTVSVADCTCSENTTGAYVYNGGIVLIDTKTSPTLGGSTHKHTGGIIAKGDGTLL